MLVLMHVCIFEHEKEKRNDGNCQKSFWYPNHRSCLITNTFTKLAWTRACVCTHMCLCMFVCVCVYALACEFVWLRYVLCMVMA